MTDSHPAIRPQPGIDRISLYVGGEAKLPGVAAPLKLSSNENPFGPSPKALAAFRAAADRLHIYPETSHASLRGAIGRAHGLDPERIVCGVGSDEIITFLCQGYAGPGDEVIHTEHGFGMYRISALGAGATPVEVREAERRTDVDAILAAATDRTRLVFIANPNNPTGTMIPEAEVARLAAGLPPQALLVLDGAYAEYVPGFDGHAGLVDARDNVVMTRTFSKIYGLGGLRIGWGYGPGHVVATLNRLRGPFNLSTPALAAAEAAVGDLDYVAFCRAENIAQPRPGSPRRSRPPAHRPTRPRRTSSSPASVTPPRPRPATARCAPTGSSCAASQATTCRRRCASPSATPRAAAASPKRSAPFSRCAPDGLPPCGADRPRADRLVDQPRDAPGGDADPHHRLRPLRGDAREAARARPRRDIADRGRGRGGRRPRDPLHPRRGDGGGGGGDRAASRARRHGHRRRLRQAGGDRRGRAAYARGRPLRPRPSAGGHRAFRPRLGLRVAVRQPLVPADAVRRTPTRRRSRSLRAFWEALGARVDLMDPDHHDLVLAVTSHVPHLIAYTMVGVADDLKRVTESEVINYSAAGFRDFTRIAASDPTMWRDVFLSNKDATLDILGRFTEELFALQRAIRLGDGPHLHDYFTRTRAIRRGIIEAGQDTPAPDFGRSPAPAGE